MQLAYPAANLTMKTLLKLFADWQVQGAENVPRTGPLIVIANHQSNVDPPLLAASLPRHLYFVAHQGLFRGPVASAFLRSYGAFPRTGASLQTIHWILSQLKSEKAVALFPEGTRSPGGMKEPFSSGVASLALRSGAPLLPVGIVGTERLGPIWRVLMPTGQLKVIVGQPFTLPPANGKAKPEHLQNLTEMIMKRVAALLPEDRRGVYRS